MGMDTIIKYLEQSEKESTRLNDCQKAGIRRRVSQWKTQLVEETKAPRKKLKPKKGSQLKPTLLGLKITPNKTYEDHKAVMENVRAKNPKCKVCSLNLDAHVGDEVQ